MASAIIEQLETYGPQRCAQLSYDEATAYTRQLAESHYENFTVVSWLLPRRLRADFRNIYAFCRWADDLGDETGDPDRSLELLAWWRRELDDCYAGRPRHPVFVALHQTIERHDIPRQPFDDLIDAFVQDQTTHRYDSWQQVLDYCSRSANPVGRLVLYVCGYRDDHRQRLSDATCTGLQLANFWQDVRRDVLERNRVYIPRDLASQYSLDVDAMATVVRCDEAADRSGTVRCRACPPSAGITAILPAYQQTMRALVQRTWPLFIRGRELWPHIAADLRVDIALFSRGGESILRMIERQNYDTLQQRPALSRFAKFRLLAGALTCKWLPGRKERIHA